jgi:hypothetical protein
MVRSAAMPIDTCVACQSGYTALADQSGCVPPAPILTPITLTPTEFNFAQLSGSGYYPPQGGPATAVMYTGTYPGSGSYNLFYQGFTSWAAALAAEQAGIQLYYQPFPGVFVPTKYAFAVGDATPLYQGFTALPAGASVYAPAAAGSVNESAPYPITNFSSGAMSGSGFYPPEGGPASAIMSTGNALYVGFPSWAAAHLYEESGHQLYYQPSLGKFAAITYAQAAPNSTPVYLQLPYLPVGANVYSPVQAAAAAAALASLDFPSYYLQQPVMSAPGIL